MSELTTSERSSQETTRFTEMMELTERRAYSMAIQLTRNSTEAEDLMQETAVKAWRGFDSYMPGRPFLNWLLRIMQRAYLDSRRRDNPVRKAESLNSMMSPPDVYRQAIELCDLNELTYSEIAEIQNTTIGTVRSRIHRGRRFLREIVQKNTNGLLMTRD